MSIQCRQYYNCRFHTRGHFRGGLIFDKSLKRFIVFAVRSSTHSWSGFYRPGIVNSHSNIYDPLNSSRAGLFDCFPKFFARFRVFVFARMRVFQSSFFVIAAAASWQDFEFKELKEILEEHVPDESIKGRGHVMARDSFYVESWWSRISFGFPASRRLRTRPSCCECRQFFM